MKRGGMQWGVWSLLLAASLAGAQPASDTVLSLVLEGGHVYDGLGNNARDLLDGEMTGARPGRALRHLAGE